MAHLEYGQLGQLRPPPPLTRARLVVLPPLVGARDGSFTVTPPRQPTFIYPWPLAVAPGWTPREPQWEHPLTGTSLVRF